MVADQGVAAPELRGDSAARSEALVGCLEDVGSADRVLGRLGLRRLRRVSEAEDMAASDGASGCHSLRERQSQG